MVKPQLTPLDVEDPTSRPVRAASGPSRPPNYAKATFWLLVGLVAAILVVAVPIAVAGHGQDHPDHTCEVSRGISRTIGVDPSDC